MLGIWRLVAMVNVLLSAMVLAGPNVVVVLTDDQGYGDASAHGNPDLKTPVMEALREEATALDRFFVSPTCAPTRAALLPGRHEFAVGVSHTVAGRSLLRPEVPTLAEVTLMLDLDAGPVEMEAWLEGPLLGEKKLAAFFVDVERLGERKRSKAEFHVNEARGR